ncbi:BRO1 domain-containing protein [Dioscorea alata]|uniref:BRO1 domain-containing protein n=1 Tax=Dioscorea alata TaxID=55571 RepID=A0ACB7UTP8_DIOAL|nr:BRO1 domain-containing protein [Dioscorea alata]
MGCTSSIPGRYKNGRRKKKKGSRIAEVAVFVPCLRIPVAVDLQQGLRGIVGREVVDRIMQRRSRIVLLAQENVLEAVEGILEVQRALEDYLPVLIGLIEKERRLEALVEFKWRSLGDNGQEICLASAWYELLSVIHMMAMLSLLQANQLLIPKDCADARERKVSEDAKKVAVDLLLKASGFLEYNIHHILVHLPIHIRRNLPKDLQEGVLEAISIQALAQGVEMQLGLAMECEKATLPVKRRLACEEVIYFAQDAKTAMQTEGSSSYSLNISTLKQRQLHTIIMVWFSERVVNQMIKLVQCAAILLPMTSSSRANELV